MYFLVFLIWIVVLSIVLYPKVKRKEISKSMAFLLFGISFVIAVLVFFSLWRMIIDSRGENENFILEIVWLLFIFIGNPILAWFFVSYLLKKFHK